MSVCFMSGSPSMQPALGRSSNQMVKLPQSRRETNCAIPQVVPFHLFGVMHEDKTIGLSDVIQKSLCILLVVTTLTQNSTAITLKY